MYVHNINIYIIITWLLTLINIILFYFSYLGIILLCNVIINFLILFTIFN